MMQAREHDRRFRDWDPTLKAGTRPCRLCLRVVEFAPSSIEKTDMHVYARCPNCEGSFPIRHSDVDALSGSATPPLR
jgi:hypothetical protein